MRLVDTHAHIHFDEYRDDIDTVFAHAREAGVSTIITIGTDELDSARAVSFVRESIVSDIDLYATVGLHPHDAKNGIKALDEIAKILDEKDERIVAIGECGLDYFRNLSPKETQEELLRAQIELAQAHDLPLVFHVRDAWDDFFRIIADYPGVRGVIHSFTGGPREVELGKDAGLYFALNGIMTFTKLESQLEAARLIPLERLLLETDCPFLAPAPNRGKRNEPANVATIAEFLAAHRGESLAELAEATTANAVRLFKTARKH